MIAPPTPSLRHMNRQRVNVGEIVAELRGRLKRSGQVSFEDVTSGGDRLAHGMTLIACLELARRGEARLAQPVPFGDITVHRSAAGDDRSGPLPGDRGAPVHEPGAPEPRPPLRADRGGAGAGAAGSWRSLPNVTDPPAGSRWQRSPGAGRCGPDPTWAASAIACAHVRPKSGSRRPHLRRSRSSPISSRCSRPDISRLRGVSADATVASLLERGMIEEAGRSHEGGAMRYRTTPAFQERFGLKGPGDLPPITEFELDRRRGRRGPPPPARRRAPRRRDSHERDPMAGTGNADPSRPGAGGRREPPRGRAAGRRRARERQRPRPRSPASRSARVT